MATSSKKTDTKALTTQKHHRRQWVTFVRMCRYGVNNFTRNAWMTVAATAVMTITLLIVFAGVVSHQVLTNTVDTLRDRVNMSIYLKTDTTLEQAEAVADELRGVSSVLDVGIISPDAARTDFMNDNKDDAQTLEALKEATNAFPWTLSIRIQDINDTSALQDFVANNETLKEVINTDRDPSFAGSRRDAIESIGRIADFAQRVGIIASSVFIAISMLIIFNTIRMAIFNRREEIQMMKLIGADRSFIRGPFVVEAVVYGFFAAIIASGIGYALMVSLAPPLQAAGISMAATLDFLIIYAGFVVLGMIMVGAIIGIISSLMATRRHLRV